MSHNDGSKIVTPSTIKGVPAIQTNTEVLHVDEIKGVHDDDSTGPHDPSHTNDETNVGFNSYIPHKSDTDAIDTIIEQNKADAENYTASQIADFEAHMDHKYRTRSRSGLRPRQATQYSPGKLRGMNATQIHGELERMKKMDLID